MCQNHLERSTLATLSIQQTLAKTAHMVQPDHQKALVAVSEIVLNAQSIAELLSRTVELTAKTLQCQRAGAFEMRCDEKTLTLRAGYGWDSQRVGHATLCMSPETQALSCLQSSEPSFVSDFEKETYFAAPDLLVEHAQRASAVIPIPMSDRAFGVLMLNDPEPRPFSMADRNFLTAVTEIIQCGIQRLRQMQLALFQVEGYRLVGRNLALRPCLEQICLQVEKLLTDGQCAIMLFEPQTHRIRLAAGPSLVPTLAQSLDSLQVGKAMDVEAIAQRHGTRACWSTPISTEPGCMVGTFAILHQIDAHPTSHELHILEVASELTAAVVRHDIQQRRIKQHEQARKQLQHQVDARSIELQSTIDQLEREINQRRQAEDQARGGEERYRDLFERSNDLIQIISREGEIRFVNRAWRQAMGYVHSEVQRLSVFDVVPPNCRTRWTELLRRVFSGENLVRVETEFFTREGKTVTVEGNLSLLSEPGRPPAARAILRDITDRKIAEEQQQKFVSLVQTSNDLIIMASHAGMVQFINNAGRELLGLTHSQPVDTLHLSDIYSPGTWSTFQNITMPAIAEIGHWDGEGAVRHRSTHKGIDVHINAFVVKHPRTGDPLCMATVQRDITQRKEVDRMRDELVATVSHELRTPLTSLRGYAELLLSRDFPKDKQNRFLKIIHDETHRLNKLINDFLDIRRMEACSQSYDFTHLQLAPLIEQVTLQFKQTAGSFKWSIQIPQGLPSVYADRDRIHQILTNLLSNAVKFTPQKKAIAIGARQQGSSVVIWVKDDGPGVPKQDQAFLFDKFYQATVSDQHKLQGSGLGLSIVKEIVNAHEGRVWLESQAGKGSTFFFSLPTVSIS
ncbi:MAG: PAS domain S-box protein [Phycisphaeraceae bacterium]|nr:PAS domain S-box protein [Phycisphaeraceae bacterium]